MTTKFNGDESLTIQLLSYDKSNGLTEGYYENYNLDKSLIGKLKSKSGHYFAIDGKSSITGDFETFDDYVKTDEIEI